MIHRRILIGLGALAVSIVGLGYSGAFDTVSSAVSPGSPAPDFRAVTLDAHPVPKGIADYRGQVVLLNLWATWCVPCRKSMPHMQKLNETFGPAGRTEGGLVVLGIAIDDAGGKVVVPFYKKLKITYPMLADPPAGPAAAGVAATAKDMKKKYGVQEIPVVYLIDATGTITHAHVGATDAQIADLDKAIAVLLGGAAK